MITDRFFRANMVQLTANPAKAHQYSANMCGEASNKNRATSLAAICGLERRSQQPGHPAT